MDEIESIATSSLSLEEKIRKLVEIKNKDLENFMKVDEYYRNYAEVYNSNMAFIDQTIYNLENSDMFLSQMKLRKSEVLKSAKRLILSGVTCLIGMNVGYILYYYSNNLYAALGSTICGCVVIGSTICVIGCNNELNRYDKSIDEYTRRLNKGITYPVNH